MPPAQSVAKSASTHSGLFSESKATRSPGRSPRAWKPSESRRTVVSTSAVEIFTHAPSRLTIIRSGFGWIRQDSRISWFSVGASDPGIRSSFRAGSSAMIHHEVAAGDGNAGGGLALPDHLDELGRFLGE